MENWQIIAIFIPTYIAVMVLAYKIWNRASSMKETRW
jgi:hypothetical protein